MKIYTKTGDSGETGLFAGPRVPKDDHRIEAYGTVDELNALLGQARSISEDGGVGAILAVVQSDLFRIGAELATVNYEKLSISTVEAIDIQRLEDHIDRLEKQLSPLTEFILPGGTQLAASLHAARTVCRRAERRIVTLRREILPTEFANCVAYINRLSDLLFVMARYANHSAGHDEIAWRK